MSSSAMQAGTENSMLRRTWLFCQRNPLLVFLLLAATVGITYNSPILLQDLPDWVAQGQELAARMFGGAINPEFVLKPFPVPNSALTVLIALIGSLTGFILAGKLIALASIWWLAIMIARLLWRLDPENAAPKAVVAFGSVVLSSSFFNGYLAYQLGLCLLATFLYWWLLKEGRSLLGIVLFGLAIFFCHAGVFGVFMLLVLALSWRTKAFWVSASALVFPILLMVWYSRCESQLHVISTENPLIKHYGSLTEWAMYKVYTFSKLGPFHNFLLPDGKSVYQGKRIAVVFGIASNVIVGLALAINAALAVRNSFASQTSDLIRKLTVASSLIILISLVLPPSLTGVVNPGERLLIPAIGVLLLLHGLGRRPMMVLAGVNVVWILASVSFFLKADTNYERVMKTWTSYRLSADFHPSPKQLSERAALDRPNTGERGFFNHDAYRFFNLYNAMHEGRPVRSAFDTGMFYYRTVPRSDEAPDRTDSSQVLTSLGGGSSTKADALCYLTIPVPKDKGVDDCLWGVQQAHDNGWDGVVVGIGATSNPIKRDWSGMQQFADLAASYKLRVHIRMLEAADANLYKNGVPTPSWWAVNYNGGVPWPQPFRLPPKVAEACAKLNWQKGFDIVYNSYQQHGLDPTVYITCEGANEADIGGANGPMLGGWSSLGSYWKKFQKEWKDAHGDRGNPNFELAHQDYTKVFPESFWRNGDPEPEGYIEPGFFSMLRIMLSNFDSHGCKVFPLTLEGTYGAVGQEEIDSYTGPDAEWIASHYGNRAGFNRYMTVPANSPAECGANYVEREEDQVARMRRNPLLTGELFNTEFGMQNNPYYIRGNFDIAEGRQAVLDAERQLTNIVGGGYFNSFEITRLDTGFNLYSHDRTPVGKFAVGPARG